MAGRGDASDIIRRPPERQGAPGLPARRTAGAARRSERVPMTLQQLLAILRARRAAIGLALAVAAAGSIAASLLLPARYTATARVLVQVGVPESLLGAGALAVPTSALLATQVDIATSQRVALQVVDALGLADGPQALAERRAHAGAAGSTRHHWSDRLLQDLRVEPSGESSVLSIAFTAADPAFAATVANVFADAYAALALELRSDAARQAGAVADARLRTLREALETAQDRLGAYRRSAGFVAGDGRLDAEVARLAELTARLAALPVEVAGTAPVGREAAASTVPAAPQAATGDGHEAGLRAAIERQQARVRPLQAARDELMLLEREVESAQRDLDAAARRASQAPLDGQGGQAAVTVLSPAVAPERPSSPRPGLLVAAGLLLGGLLGVGGALLSERRDRRVRSPLDLQQASGLRPIGTLRDAFGGRGSPRIGAPAGAIGRAPWQGGTADEGEATRPFPPTSSGAPPERPESPAAAGAAGSGRAGGSLPIGQLMVSAGLINPPEVERILAWARADGVRFGEAAVAHRLVTEAQLERVLARQFDYPVLEPGASRVSAEVVAAFDAHNPLVADLRRLRARIRSAQLAAPPGSPLKAFAVVSSGAGDGKTFVAANLAVTFAQTGQRTLLIDADLRRGRLHRLFGLDNRTGLSSMLNRRIEPGALQRVPGMPNLGIVTCGPSAPNPSELLSRDVFAHLLASFARAYDVIVLDTSGVAEEPDATLVAQHAGAALVLARKDRSAFDAVVELVGAGGVPQVPVLGSVLNEA